MTRLVLSETASLFDGDELNAPVLDGCDYHVYVARGRTLDLLWFDGTVALVAEIRTGQPSPPPEPSLRDPSLARADQA
ncbi:MAG TPA: hypothetical protein ENK57_06380 [Polyangiaceae bacterium]|nr:hypothetical protein [Polyangiaceae bacterium]